MIDQQSVEQVDIVFSDGLQVQIFLDIVGLQSQLSQTPFFLDVVRIWSWRRQAMCSQELSEWDRVRRVKMLVTVQQLSNRSTKGMA